MKLQNATSKAIVLNLGDGLTTSLSFLLPMVLFGGQLNPKALIIGATGSGVSMAFNLDDSENGKGTRMEFIAAFLSSAIGGLLPILPFMLLAEPYSGIVSTLIVLAELAFLIYVKQLSMPVKTAIFQVTKSTIPAIIIVSALSLIA